MDQGYTTPQSKAKRLKYSRTYERGYAINLNVYPNTCSFFDFFFFLVEKSRQAPIRSSRRSVCVKKGKMSQNSVSSDLNHGLGKKEGRVIVPESPRTAVTCQATVRIDRFRWTAQSGRWTEKGRR
jgi:hypothetical protein